MQFNPQAVPPVGIIFDCDLGGDVDDALAMALLYGLDGKGECRVVGTTVSRPNLKAAALAEIIARFYSGAVNASFNAVGRTLPVGLATSGAGSEDTPILTATLARKTPEGKPAYAHGIERMADTADPIDILRNGLSAQHPQNAIVVLAGPATNVAALVKYPPAQATIQERARLLVVAAGSYSGDAVDPAIKADVAAAKALFSQWPTPIIAVGTEVGEAVPFPGASIEKDFAWSPAHPVVDAYKAFKPMPYDASTTAMAAVLAAVRPKQPGFQLSQPGTITVSEDGRTKFTPSASGKHRYLVVDHAQKSQLQQVYVELASAKPVPRMPRRRPPQQQQEQQQQQPQPAKPKPSVQ
jgi:inosine-uridine nucleoside N-ribohydrolase